MNVKQAYGDTPLARAAGAHPNPLPDDPPACQHGVMAGRCDACLDSAKVDSGYAAVRAKMSCNSIETTTNRYGPHESHRSTYTKVKLGCIYGTEGENADYSKATPSGECWMQIDEGTKAAEFFKPGKRYYVTFTEAPQ